MKYISNKKQKKIFTAIFGGLLCLLIAACAGQQTDMSKLCGEWESTGGKPDIRITKDGECYRLTLFARKGMTGKMEPETYLIQEKDGAIFIDTGFHVDMVYDKEKDMLTFSTNGSYIRKS